MRFTPRVHDSEQKRDEIVKFNRGDEKAVRSELPRLIFVQDIWISRDQDHWCVCERMLGRAPARVTRRATQAAEDLHPTKSLDIEVEKYHVEGAEAEDLDCLDAAGDGAGPEPPDEQALGQEHPQVLVAGDDEDMGSLAGQTGPWRLVSVATGHGRASNGRLR